MNDTLCRNNSLPIEFIVACQPTPTPEDRFRK